MRSSLTLLAFLAVFLLSTLAALAEQPLPRLLELGSDKCIPCRMMEPVLKDLRKEYAGKLQVDFIDVWKNPDEGKKYRVRLIPTQIFFDACGNEIYRHRGYFSKSDIVEKFSEAGVSLEDISGESCQSGS